MGTLELGVRPGRTKQSTGTIYFSADAVWKGKAKEDKAEYKFQRAKTRAQDSILCFEKTKKQTQKPEKKKTPNKNATPVFFSKLLAENKQTKKIIASSFFVFAQSLDFPAKTKDEPFFGKKQTKKNQKNKLNLDTGGKKNGARLARKLLSELANPRTKNFPTHFIFLNIKQKKRNEKKEQKNVKSPWQSSIVFCLTPKKNAQKKQTKMLTHKFLIKKKKKKKKTQKKKKKKINPKIF